MENLLTELVQIGLQFEVTRSQVSSSGCSWWYIRPCVFGLFLRLIRQHLCIFRFLDCVLCCALCCAVLWLLWTDLPVCRSVIDGHLPSRRMVRRRGFRNGRCHYTNLFVVILSWHSYLVRFTASSWPHNLVLCKSLRHDRLSESQDARKQVRRRRQQLCGATSW